MRTLIDNINTKDIEQENYSETNIKNLLKGDKRIVAFMGTSKSGTSFILNNIAMMLSSQGVNVAILDTTQNKNTYYIYTKNQENLRKLAITSIEDLSQGEANGLNVNSNLSVYTALPGENKYIKEVEPILETLLKKHSLILIDCDFKTPINYYEYVNQLYLVQTMDILTIQPLTEILSELKNKGVLQEEKLRVIINKYIKMQGITEKEIIGGMSYYNDPAMSYMKELFNRNLVKYTTIPFEKEIYERYLESVASCEINLEGYPYSFIRTLNELCDEIYPFVVGNKRED